MNTVIAFLLRGGAKESMNMRAAYVHMAGDALSSLGVLIAGLVVRATGWRYADPTVSVLIAFFIIYSSWGIVREATDVLLEGTPNDLHTWTVSDGMNYLSCHVVVDETCTMPDCGDVLHDINHLLAEQFKIAHATVQVETSRLCAVEGKPAPLFCGEADAKDAHDFA